MGDIAHEFGLGPAKATEVLREFGIFDGNTHSRVRNPVVPEKPEGRKMTIVSVFPKSAFNKVFHFGEYEMPPCPPCEHGTPPESVRNARPT